LRWLQKVETTEAIWDAFEASDGKPFARLVEEKKCVPWSTLRHWLHDLASELWDATGDGTLPAELSLDHVWITAEGRAVLLDEPWPHATSDAERIAIGDVTGQQRFLSAIAACVEATSLPLHARGVLQNIKERKFEKLSFLAGTLRGLLDKPAEVSRPIRAGSIFMLALYVWIAVFVGYYHDKQWGSVGWMVLTTTWLVLGTIALLQLVELQFRSTASHDIFRLAVVNAQGKRAGRMTLLRRWAIVWVPLFVPTLILAWLIKKAEPAAALIGALTILGLWMCGAVYAVIHPHRGLHDRLAGTWVVRR
jgi:hypothetical protein